MHTIPDQAALSRRSAADILKRCDGRRDDVVDFLRVAAERGWLH